MTHFFRFLLWFFPASFSQRFGPEWMDVAESLWSENDGKTWPARVASVVRLTWDTLTQAPMEHARDLYKAAFGTANMPAPILAQGITLSGALYLAGGPGRLLNRALWQHVLFFCVGLVGFAASYTVLSVKTGQSLRWMTPTWVFLAPLALLLGALAYRGGKQWKAQGWSLLAPLVFAVFGFFTALEGMFAWDGTRVQEQIEAPMGTVASRLQRLPYDLPLTSNVKDWSIEQKRWYEVLPSGDIGIRPAMKEAFCDVKRSHLNRWESSLLTNESLGNYYNADFWNIEALTSVSMGCLSLENAVDRYAGILNSSLKTPVGLLKVWTPYAAVRSKVDDLTAAPYLTVLSAKKDAPFQYCLTLAMARSPLSEPDVEQATNACRAYQTQWLSVHASAAVSHASTATEGYKQNATSIPPFTSADLPALRAYIEREQHTWRRSNSTPETPSG